MLINDCFHCFVNIFLFFLVGCTIFRLFIPIVCYFLQNDFKMSDVLKVVRLSSKAKIPTRGSKFAAAYDLYSANSCVIPPKGKALVVTDLQIKVPDGTYGRIAPRSGLALTHSLTVGGGVIDPDYSGNVGIILFNHGDCEFAVSEGMRIAQLICEKMAMPDLVICTSLDDTGRGDFGFGSTGLF